WRNSNKEKTDCQTCWIFSNNTCNYWICRSFKEIFRRRETTQLFDNDYCFDFRTYCKRNLSLYFAKVKEQGRSSYESKYDCYLERCDYQFGSYNRWSFSKLVEFKQT